MTDLRALALAATPGPWHKDGMTEVLHDLAFVARANPDDAAFIAAASPAVVLALLDCVSALRYHNLTPAGNVRKCLPGCVACAALARYEEVTK